MAVDTSQLGIKYVRKNNHRFPNPVVNRLFVYGIFLGEERRKEYGMSNARYATVPGYVTFGGHIVQAQKVDGVAGLQLTGLTVDINPFFWDQLDMLEAG